MVLDESVDAPDVRLLRQLAELDYDLVRAYETAIWRLDDDAIRGAMRELVEKHRRKIFDLNSAIIDLGGRPWTLDDFRHVVDEAKVFLASIVGDRAIVRAMLKNEERVSRACERASVAADLPAPAQRLLDVHVAEEQAHRTSLQRILSALER